MAVRAASCCSPAPGLQRRAGGRRPEAAARRLRLESGVPPHLVQAIARHADVDITLKIYAHTNLDARREGMKRLYTCYYRWPLSSSG